MHIGAENLGNTCYMNSVWQAISSCETVAGNLLKINSNDSSRLLGKLQVVLAQLCGLKNENGPIMHGIRKVSNRTMTDLFNANRIVGLDERNAEGRFSDPEI